jgi:hypothetical protein
MRISRRGIIAVLTACVARAQTTLQFDNKAVEPFLTVSVRSSQSGNWLVVRTGTREGMVPFSEVMDALQRDPARWEVGPALNNQCPVCGQMAEPFTRPTSEVSEYLKDADGNPLLDADGNYIVLKVAPEQYGPMFNLARCARCNTAFYQDADR